MPPPDKVLEVVEPKDHYFLQLAVNEPVQLSAYNPQWPAQFEKEKSRLLRIFSGDLVEIEHVGSTAVPGMAAKPIIDILAGLRVIERADALLEPLCGYGYETPLNCNDGLTDRRWLLRQTKGHRTHHLHLVSHGGETWNRVLKFRDILRDKPETARRYEDLKYQLAQTVGLNRTGYILGKGEFVEQTLESGGAT